MKFHLIDVSGYVFRAYHALPPLTSPLGLPIGAVHGFFQMIFPFIEKNEPFALVCDTGRQTFRNEIYKEYKATRPPPPDDLKVQFGYIFELTQSLSLLRFECPLFEADDVIATLVRHVSEFNKNLSDTSKNIFLTIHSSDKDLMQLVHDPYVALYDSFKGKTTTEKEVFEKFGVPPLQVLDVLSLAGDASDNIPGVPGIGLKTARDLIIQYESIENLIKNIHNVPQKKRKETLETNIEQLLLSKRLVELVNNAPLDPLQLGRFWKIVEASLKKDFVPGFSENAEQSILLFKRFGLNEVADRFGKVLKKWSVSISHHSITEYKPLDFMSLRFQTLLSRATQLIVYPVLSRKGIKDELLVMALGVEDEEDTLQISLITDLVDEKAFFLLEEVLKDSSILKIGFDLKRLITFLHLKVDDLTPITPFHDIELMSYALYSGKYAHTLKTMCILHDFLFEEPEIIEKKASARNSFSSLGYLKEGQKRYDEKAVIQNTLSIQAIGKTLKQKLVDARLLGFYDFVERPLPPIVAHMEFKGIMIDPVLLETTSASFKKQQRELETEIFKIVGKTFNLASPKQLGEVFFEKLKLPLHKRTKTGAYSTDTTVLEELAREGHTLASLVLKWRHFDKLLSTYVTGLLAHMDPMTHRIHSSFSLTGTVTGRFSSSEPNLQNIPIKTKEGRLIRRAFVAKPGYTFLSLDYSQIELRLLAHLSSEEHLINAFKNGRDIHRLTASLMFSKKYEEVDDDERQKAKTVNFGIIYGMGAQALSKQLNTSVQEADAFIKVYFNTYPKISEYIEKTKKFAEEHEFVETIFGRHIHIKNINSPNIQLKRSSERQAINAPLQGSNADIMKIAMNRIWQSKQESIEQKDFSILLQIHDELLFEIKDEYLGKLESELIQLMQNIGELRVPLLVTASTAKCWDDM